MRSWFLVASAILTLFLLGVLAAEEQGLTATYFDGKNLSGTPIFTQVEAGVLKSPASVVGPAAGVPATNFSARWTGSLLVPASGVYTFSSVADDGVRLWIDGLPVFSDWTAHAPHEVSGSIALSGGTWVNLVLEFFQGEGPYEINLAWAGGGLAKQQIPVSVLRPDAAPSRFVRLHPGVTPGDGLRMQCWGNRTFDGTPLLSIVDPTVNHPDWTSSPLPGVPQSNFSVRWSGFLVADEEGVYTLTTTSDDGVRLWLNNSLVINDWIDHGSTDNSTVVHLTAGQRLPLIMEFYQGGGSSVAQLSWAFSGLPRHIIPQTNLFSTETGIYGNGTGLTGCYYRGENFDDLKFIRTDPGINYTWSGAPDPKLPSDHFSVRWLGEYQALFSGPVTLIFTSDDGGRLWMGNRVVAESWKNQGATDVAYTFPALAGQKYPIRLDYYECTGGASARLDVQSVNEPRRPVLLSQLYPFRGVSIAIPEESAVSPVCLEGMHTPGATVTLTASGAVIPVRALSALSFFADVHLAEQGETPIRCSDGTTTQEGSVAWTPTEVVGDKVLTIRAGDALRLAFPGASRWQMQNYGGILDEGAVHADKPLIRRFDAPGYFEVAALDADGAKQARLSVTVLSLHLDGPIACEVGYQRLKHAIVAPSSESAAVSFEAGDPTIFEVVNNGPLTNGDGSGVALGLKALRRGTPVLAARVGKGGAILAAKEIDEFTVEIPFRNSIVMTADHEIANVSVIVRPYIPNAWLRMTMFAHTATFEGGLKAITKCTTPGIYQQLSGTAPVGAGEFIQVPDPVTGELIGRYDFRMEVPNNESRACVAVDFIQPGSEWRKISSTSTVNPCFCKAKSFQSLILPREQPPEPDKEEIWDAREFTMISTEQEASCCSYSVTAAHVTITPTVQSCDGKCGDATVIKPRSEPGKYPRTIVAEGGCTGGGESGYYIVSRLDAHDEKGISNRLRKHVGALWKRAGTVDEPVIIVVSGGEDNSFYGNVCEKTNVWSFKAKYDRPAWDRRSDATSRGEGVTPYKWEQDYRIRWDIGDGDYVSGSSESDDITVRFPSGRHIVRLAVQRRTRGPSDPEAASDYETYTDAEIHHLNVEEIRSTSLAMSPSPISAPFGTPFVLSNTNGQKIAVDAKLRAVGTARARVSLDGYPQNQYWGGATDALDYPQALSIADGTPAKLWLNGYDSFSGGLDDTNLEVSGQEMIEQCTPIPCHGIFDEAAVKVGWVVTDLEPFAVYRMKAQGTFASGGAQMLRGMFTDSLPEGDGGLAKISIDGPAPAITWGRWKPQDGYTDMEEYSGPDKGLAAQRDGRYFSKTDSATTYCTPVEQSQTVHPSFPERQLLLAAMPQNPEDGGPSVYGFTLVRCLVLGVPGIGDVARDFQGNRKGLPAFGSAVSAESFFEERGIYLTGISYRSREITKTAADSLQIALLAEVGKPQADRFLMARVDLMGVSYGGVVVRWLAEQLLPLNAHGKPYVRKVVTLASPHWGSPAANLLMDGAAGKFAFCDLEGQLASSLLDIKSGNYTTAISNNGVLDPTTPGVESLVYKSADIRALNASPFHAQVAYGSVAATDDTFITLNFFEMLVPLAGVDVSSSTSATGTWVHPGEHRGVFPWIYSLEAGKNDMLVPVWSARLPAKNADVDLTHGEVYYRTAALSAAYQHVVDPELPKGDAHRQPFLSAMQNLPYRQARDTMYARTGGAFTNPACWNYVRSAGMPNAVALIATGMRDRAAMKGRWRVVTWEGSNPSSVWDVAAPWGSVVTSNGAVPANELVPFIVTRIVSRGMDPNISILGPAYFGRERPTFVLDMEGPTLSGGDEFHPRKIPGQRTQLVPKK